MTRLRLFVKMDDKNKIALPGGMRRELNIKPGDRLELTLDGINKAREITYLKTKRGR